ncbi:MAG: hypothetical protein KJ709_00845 [Nanoarchaeota archaeon]|nr:hypothetical protein [Nanoarchaeota archaeon]
MEKRGISHYRTPDYRVFYAAPYFNVDLDYELEWHKKHVKKLRKHREKPHLFHQQHSKGKTSHERYRHFEEHVVKSIPFHEKFIRDHERRLRTMLGMLPKKRYKALQTISRKTWGVPEYFIYDKANKKPFFVAERPGHETTEWIRLVRKKKLCEVIVLDE